VRGQYWDPDFDTRPWPWVEAWQAQQLARWLDELPQRSGLYRDALSGAGRRRGLRGYWVARGALPTLEMMEGLPFTSKDQLRQGQEQAPPGRPFGLQQAVPLEDIVQVVSSSGTTGRPVFFGLTRRDLEIWSDAIANVFWTAGIRPDDVIAHMVSLPVVAGGWPYADGLRRLGATVAWLGGYQPDQMLARLPMLQVTAMLTTTSFGVYLTEQAIAGRMARDLGVKKLLAGGEPGLAQPEIRRKIADGWGMTHIREMMGLADVMANLWSECDEAGGMHFNAARYVIVELLQPDTGARVPWQEGARGEAVYTTFDRDATPVLRYRSADHLEVTGVRCACGRGSPRIRCVGRTDDMLIYKAMNVFPSAIRDVVLKGFGDLVEPYLRIWKESAEQVRFDGPIPVEVEARAGVAGDRFEAVAELIGKAVREELQVRVDLSLVPAGPLPRSAYKTPLGHARPDGRGNGHASNGAPKT